MVGVTSGGIISMAAGGKHSWGDDIHRGATSTDWGDVFFCLEHTSLEPEPPEDLLLALFSKLRSEKEKQSLLDFSLQAQARGGLTEARKMSQDSVAMK